MLVSLVVLPPSLLPLPFSSSHRATFAPPRPPLPHSEDTNGAAQTHPNWHNWCRRKWKSEWCGEGVEGVDCGVHSLLVQPDHCTTAEHLSSSKPMYKNIHAYVYMYIRMSVLVYIHTCVLLCICTYVKGCKFVVAPTYCILYNAYCIFVWTYIRTYICTYVHTYLECMHVYCFLYVRMFIFVMCFVRMPIYALVFCGSIPVVCSELLQGLHSQHGAPRQRLLQGK